MTLFKKYYKEANEEIVADEVLISRVIANAHKPPVKRNQYIKHVATLAAAVFVVSAAVISMPVWQKVEEEAEISIEEFVENTPSPTVMQSEFSEENTFPVPSHQRSATVAPPENDYDSSNITEEKEVQTEQNDDSSSKTVSTSVSLKEKIEPTLSAPLSESETKTDKVEETIKSEDNEGSTANSVQIQSDSEKENPLDEGSDGSGYGPIAGSSSSSSSSSSGGGGGGGSVGNASSGAFYDAPSAVTNVYIPTPPGFYSTGSGSGYAYFASDSGARITVSYSSCNYSSSPSYSEDDDIITANFATGSVAYSIYAVGADMSDVEYIVNSLY